MTDLTELGARIKARMDELQLTESELEELTELSHYTIHRMLHGDDVPYRFNRSSAEAVAEVLQVPVRSLFRPGDISDLGRPPHTGRSLQLTVRLEQTSRCTCGLINPSAAEECDLCGRPV